MKKTLTKSLFIIILVFLLIIFSVFVSGVASLGVTPPITYLTYGVDSDEELKFTILPAGEDWVKITDKTDLKDEGVIIYKDIEDLGFVHLQGNKDVYFRLNLTEEEALPGNHKIKIYAAQRDPPLEPGEQAPAGIRAKAAVAHVIKLFVPYDGPFLQMDFYSAENVRVGENVFPRFKLKNLGKIALNDLVVYIDIFDSDGVKVATTNTPVVNLEPLEEQDVFAEGKVNGLGVGRYKAVARASYGGQVRETEKEFLIGDINVNIVDIRFNESQSVGRIYVDVESKWNEALQSVYAQINILDSGKNSLETIKSETFSLQPWEKKTVNLYFEQGNLPVGLYSAEVTLHYSGLTTTKTKGFYLTKDSIVEKPSSFFSSTNLLLIIIVILLVFLSLLAVVSIQLFLKDPHHHKKGKKSGKPIVKSVRKKR